jgi:hypothetical protein
MPKLGLEGFLGKRAKHGGRLFVHNGTDYRKGLSDSSTVSPALDEHLKNIEGAAKDGLSADVRLAMQVARSGGTALP